MRGQGERHGEGGIGQMNAPVALIETRVSGRFPSKISSRSLRPHPPREPGTMRSSYISEPRSSSPLRVFRVPAHSLCSLAPPPECVVGSSPQKALANILAKLATSPFGSLSAPFGSFGFFRLSFGFRLSASFRLPGVRREGARTEEGFGIPGLYGRLPHLAGLGVR